MIATMSPKNYNLIQIILELSQNNFVSQKVRSKNFVVCKLNYVSGFLWYCCRLYIQIESQIELITVKSLDTFLIIKIF